MKYLKYTIFVLCLLVIISPRSVINNETVYDKKPAYKLLGYTSTREQIKQAVIEEFGHKMAKIVACESSFNLKARNINTNGSMDYGLFQINSVHVSNAFKMGIDIYTIEGQFDYARYLISKNGYRDWVCSRKVI